MMLIIGAIVALFLTVVLTVIFRKKEIRFSAFNLLVHPAVLLNWVAYVWAFDMVYVTVDNVPTDATVASILAVVAYILNAAMAAFDIIEDKDKKPILFNSLAAAMFFVTFAASILYPVVYGWRTLYYGAFALGTIGLWLIILTLVFVGVVWDKLAKLVTGTIERRCDNG